MTGSREERSPAQESALMSALVTEHFVLQSAASATISESGSRASIYLGALSSGLVAIGFSTASPAILSVLISTVLPTIFVLGCFTVVRLIDTSIANIVALQRIEAIRQHYLTISPTASQFFGTSQTRAPTSLGVTYGAGSALFTTASMIAVVNAVVGGAGTATILSIQLNGSSTISTVAGIALGLTALAASLAYQARRFKASLTSPES